LRNNPIIIQLRKNISGQGRYKYNEVNWLVVDFVLTICILTKV
jgi:hypothetical protein